MSYILINDPHPGRCKNYRRVSNGTDGETVRCLDYEDTEHVCTFPEPRNKSLEVNSSHRWSKLTVMSPLIPWVKPA